MRRSIRKWVFGCFCGLPLLIAVISDGHAEITLDGSMGPKGALNGPNFQIGAELGKRAGSNLFHSFGRFNIGSKESATFTGPAAIDNVIGRVTGGSSSTIDGQLRSEIPSANLWLVNPNGVVFGKNAKLDVKGSFHVTTANYLKLKDGARFDAIPSTNDSRLTTAPPEAFGFLDNHVAPITVQGGPKSELKVPEGKTLSVVGGDLKIQGGKLSAPGGRINLASVASKGEITLKENDLKTGSIKQLGDIRMSQQGLVSTSGKGGGAIFIRGGQFVAMDRSSVQANTLGARDGKNIDVEVDRLRLSGGAQIAAGTASSGDAGNLYIKAQNITLSGRKDGFSSGFVANTAGKAAHSGDAGDISVAADHLRLSGGAQIASGTFGPGEGGNLQIEARNITLSGQEGGSPSGFLANSQGEIAGSGGAGDITVAADRLQLQDGAQITSSTFGPGNAGSLHINAHEITLTGQDEGLPSAFFANSVGTIADSGDAGDITVKANSLLLREGAQIASATKGSGKAGDVHIHARDIFMTGFSAFLASSEGTIADSGDAGDIRVVADQLWLDEGAQIGAVTAGSGRGGNLRIEARNITLNGQKEGFPTAFYAYNAAEAADSRGAAGDITVTADNLRLSGGAQIAVATAGSGHGGNLRIDAGDVTLTGQAPQLESGLFASTLGSGAGGSIFINAQDVKVDDGARILADSTGTGPSGDIFIKALGELRLVNDGQISVATTLSNAGDITLDVGELLHLRDNSAITTSVAGGQGDGGDINIDPTFVVLDDNSRIIAQAKEGRGGNIQITADFLFQSPDSLIDASSAFGQSGVVTINSPDTNILGGITVLPEVFFDAATLMKQHCAARASGGRSSLVLKGSGSVLAEPGLTYLPAFFMDGSGENSAQPGRKSEERGGFSYGLPSTTASSLSGLAFGCNPM